MAGTTLTTHTDDRGVATLTLNRPEKANAIDRTLLTPLLEELHDVAASSSVRVVVLRGAGKHFCAGADLGDLRNGDAKGTVPELCDVLDRLPKPTICIVQGACIGAGLALAACCDTVIATRDAHFSIPEVRLGIAPAPLIPIMLRACGERFLRRHLLSGRRFDSLEAHRVGLVHEVCDSSGLDDMVARSVDDYLRAAPGAVQAAKTLLQPASRSDQPHSRHELEAMFDKMSTSHEAKEGLASFRERRSPEWYRH